jgi:hypothetical protein
MNETVYSKKRVSKFAPKCLNHCHFGLTFRLSTRLKSLQGPETCTIKLFTAIFFVVIK